MKLLEVNGNLVSQKVDFIVNPSNTTLKLGSGVSMILKRACGPELQVVMDNIRDHFYSEGKLIEQGEVFATPSFNLIDRTPYILHGAVMNYNPSIKQSDAKPTLKTVRLILENCIPYVDFFIKKHGRNPTVAFPYIGCGVGGLNKSDVKQIFKGFVEENAHIEMTIFLVEL